MEMIARSAALAVTGVEGVISPEMVDGAFHLAKSVRFLVTGFEKL